MISKWKSWLVITMYCKEVDVIRDSIKDTRDVPDDPILDEENFEI